MKIKLPKHFRIQRVEDFLKISEFVFDLKNKKMKNFILDVSKVKEICLLGHLLLYKFISYTSEKQCFLNPELKMDNDQLDLLKEYGFYDIIMAYIRFLYQNEKILRSYKKIKTIKEDGLLIYPQRLLRTESQLKEPLERELFDSIGVFYNTDKDVYNLASICIAELLSNFWSHATEDSGTVMVAYCHRNYFEVCFADNGEGIITT